MGIACRDCGLVFTFSEELDRTYRSRGLNRPTRCPDCRRLAKLFPYENLDRSMHQSPIEVVCPICDVICERVVELGYRSSEYAWRRAGYLVIICDDCKERKESTTLLKYRKALEPRKIGGWTFA